GCLLGALLGAALLTPPEVQANGPTAPTPWVERMVLRQRWELLSLLALLAVVVVTPFWLEWRDGAPGVPLDSKTYKVARVAFSPDGKRQLLAYEDGRLHVWDESTKRDLGRLQAPGVVGCAAIAPDGRSVVTGNAGWIRETAWGRRFSRGEGEP